MSSISNTPDIHDEYECDVDRSAILARMPVSDKSSIHCNVESGGEVVTGEGCCPGCHTVKILHPLRLYAIRRAAFENDIPKLRALLRESVLTEECYRPCFRNVSTTQQVDVCGTIEDAVSRGNGIRVLGALVSNGANRDTVTIEALKLAIKYKNANIVTWALESKTVWPHVQRIAQLVCEYYDGAIAAFVLEKTPAGDQPALLRETVKANVVPFVAMILKQCNIAQSDLINALGVAVTFNACPEILEMLYVNINNPLASNALFTAVICKRRESETLPGVPVLSNFKNLMNWVDQSCAGPEDRQVKTGVTAKALTIPPKLVGQLPLSFLKEFHRRGVNVISAEAYRKLLQSTSPETFNIFKWFVSNKQVPVPIDLPNLTWAITNESLDTVKSICRKVKAQQNHLLLAKSLKHQTDVYEYLKTLDIDVSEELA